MTFTVEYGEGAVSWQVTADSAEDAERKALEYVRDKRPNVRVLTPDGSWLNPEAFGDAVRSGKFADA